jgi:hypothetical protein
VPASATDFESEQKMRDVVSVLRRILVVCVIVIGTGAMSCTTIEGGIQFAPGYGYVIDVVHGKNNDHTLFVFETHAEAEKWAFNFQQTPSKSAAMRAPGYKMRVDEDDKSEEELFGKIWKARVPIPLPSTYDTTRTIDQVVPPVPTAPVPR